MRFQGRVNNGLKKIRRLPAIATFSGWLVLSPFVGAESAALQDLSAQVLRPGVSTLANIRLRTDRRVFAVMAALNVAGFAEQSSGQGMSTARNHLLEWTRDVDADLLQQLRDFYKSHDPPANLFLENPQSAYLSLSLWLGPPPDFELDVDPAHLPPDALFVRGFEELVRRFWKEANLAGLWEVMGPLHQREIELYRPLLEGIVKSALEYFRVPLRVVLGKEIILIPDLLDVKDLVNARNLERQYFVVVGPSDDPSGQRRQLEHEYLHFLLDSLIQKYGASLLEHEALLDLAQQQPNTRHDYQNQFLLVASESLIEAVHTRLSPPLSPEELENRLVGLFRRGLVLAPYFYRSLEEYETLQEQTLPAFLETIIEDLGEGAIHKDAKAIEEVEKRRNADALRLREEDRAREEQVLRHNEFVTRFNEASRLLADEQFEAARTLLLQLSEARPEDGKISFYLGQTAFQLDDYDGALEYYRQSSLAPGLELWLVAWSRVRMGRIHASRGEFAEARRLFSEVTTMEGDLRGADQDASQLLLQLP